MSKIRCSSCQKENESSSCIKEGFLPAPHEDVREGLIVCPSCGLKTHIYYMSPKTHEKQLGLNRFATNLGPQRTSQQLTAMRTLRQEYIRLYDEDQRLYGEMTVKHETAH